MALPVELVLTPDGAEFRSRPNRLGRIGAVRVAEAELENLAAYFGRVFGLPAAGTLDRVMAGLTRLAERGEIKDRYLGNESVVGTHCRRAGIGYEFRWFDTERWRTKRRRVPLFRATEPNGFLRVLSVELETSGDDGGLLLQEEFVDPAAVPPEDVHTGYSRDLHLDSASLVPLGELLAARFPLPYAERPDDRAEAMLTALVARGELGPHLPPGGNRDRFLAWCAEAGVRARADGMPRRHELLRGGDLVLELVFRADWRPPVLWFTEAYRPPRDERWGGTEYRVSVPIDAVPVLVERFERRLGTAPGPGRPDDRLIACFAALVSRGVLSGGRARQGNRRLVAEWVTEAGVTPAVEGFARREEVLRVYRPSTDCVFELVLVMDASVTGDRGIVFSESYEYLPQSGDAGREYGYSVRTPYASLPALVDQLEAVPGEGDLEERLSRCFARLVETGELGGALELQVARDRVAARFVAAGVPAVTDSSSWISSD
jgi:hypothetical protein